MSIPVTAVVYCEANFGRQDGKTANGLARHSEKFEIVSIIDSTRAGRDAGTVLDGVASGIPVVTDLAAAIARAGHVPDSLIVGMAPAGGRLTPGQRIDLLDGIAGGMNLVNGLHEFLGDDPEFASAALLAGVTITDVRRTKDRKDLQLFTGRIFDVTCPRVAVLGTDGAIGKRTTTTLLVEALNARGIRAVMVGTGQTALIQGAKYAVALDATVPQFCSGEVEAQVVAAFENEDPDIIVIEGQGALSHPAYLTSAYILRGSPPGRRHRAARARARDAGGLPGPADADRGKRDRADRVLRLDAGHRRDDQPREHDRRADHRCDRRTRTRPRHPRHRSAHTSHRAGSSTWCCRPTPRSENGLRSP